eukprot:2517600-Amphidinium_carterae.1
MEHGRQGWTVQAPKAGLIVNGHKRSQGTAKPLKVEVKSPRLCWDSTSKRWYLNFQAVRLQELDLLVLGVLTRSGAELREYNTSTRVYMCTQRKATHVTGMTLRTYSLRARGMADACTH